MDFINVFNNFLGDVVDSITKSPNNICDFVRVSDKYAERIERWGFIGRVVDVFLCVLCMLLLLAFNMVYASQRNGEYGNLYNSSILVCILILLGMLLFACKHYVEMEKNRCRREYTRDMSLAMFGIFSSYIQTKRRRLSNILVSGEKLVSNIYTLLTIFGPAFAILAPSYHRFFRLHTTMGVLHRNQQECFNFVSAIYQSIWQRIENLYLRVTGFSKARKIISGSAMAILTVAAAWYIIRNKKQIGHCIPTKIVPKKRQEICEDTSMCPPAFICNSLATIPSSPQFKGSTLVNNSLVRIKASYIATAFRCGNYLLSAVHCVGLKNQDSTEKGIWAQNPDDGKYYWAPLEKCFMNESAGDGLAICSLPNAPFFLGLKSVSLSNHRTEEYVMTFTCDVGSNKPQWSESVGPSYANEENGLCFMYSTVKPGSSGGPIMNTDGSIVAIVFAETTFNGEDVNIGILITEDMRLFLVNGGDVRPSTSGPLCQDPLNTEFIEISESNQSLLENIPTLDQNIHGQILQQHLNEQKLKNSTGQWWMKRKPKKEKKPTPPLQPDQEHPQS